MKGVVFIRVSSFLRGSTILVITVCCLDHSVNHWSFSTIRLLLSQPFPEPPILHFPQTLVVLPIPWTSDPCLPSNTCLSRPFSEPPIPLCLRYLLSWTTDPSLPSRHLSWPFSEPPIPLCPQTLLVSAIPEQPIVLCPQTLLVLAIPWTTDPSMPSVTCCLGHSLNHQSLSALRHLLSWPLSEPPILLCPQTLFCHWPQETVSDVHV